MPPTRISADFNNADPLGRVRLNSVGSIESLATTGVRLVDGLAVIVQDDDELEADGVLSFSADEHIWVAAIEWNAIRRVTNTS